MALFPSVFTTKALFIVVHGFNGCFSGDASAFPLADASFVGANFQDELQSKSQKHEIAVFSICDDNFEDELKSDNTKHEHGNL